MGADEAARKRAAEDLKNAQAEFTAARAAAAAAAAKAAAKAAATGTGATALRSTIDTATMGTFSGAALGRQQIGGFANYQKSIEENTKKIADNTDPAKNGMVYS